LIPVKWYQIAQDSFEIVCGKLEKLGKIYLNNQNSFKYKFYEKFDTPLSRFSHFNQIYFNFLYFITLET